MDWWHYGRHPTRSRDSNRCVPRLLERPRPGLSADNAVQKEQLSERAALPSLHNTAALKRTEFSRINLHIGERIVRGKNGDVTRLSRNCNYLRSESDTGCGVSRRKNGSSGRTRNYNPPVNSR